MPSKSEQQLVSTGTCLKAFLLNGLGFSERRLYLMPAFFEDKPIELLLDKGVSADRLNDDRLGRCLDDLYDYGVTNLFSQISGRACEVLGLDKGTQTWHLDSTSFHVDGKYNRDLKAENISAIQINKGYSRDHRPDLNQVILNMIVEQKAGIPLYMQAFQAQLDNITARGAEGTEIMYAEIPQKGTTIRLFIVYGSEFIANNGKPKWKMKVGDLVFDKQAVGNQRFKFIKSS